MISDLPILLLVLIFFDTALTVMGVSTGCATELNPVCRYMISIGMPAFALIKAAVAFILYYGATSLSGYDTPALLWLTRFYLVVVAWNLGMVLFILSR